MEITHTLPILLRLRQVIDTIIAAVRSHGYPHHGTPWGLIPAVHPTIVSRVWTRLTRADAAIKSLMARFRAGTLAPSTPRGKLSKPRTRTPSALKPLPSGFAWLCPLVPAKASIYGNHLMLVLAEPEMQELLAASSRAVAILKPVCRMLGIDPRVLTPVGRVSEAQPARAILPRTDPADLAAPSTSLHRLTSPKVEPHPRL
jgi:hypothetical protein